jgi:hypothetical protein
MVDCVVITGSCLTLLLFELRNEILQLETGGCAAGRRVTLPWKLPTARVICQHWPIGLTTSAAAVGLQIMTSKMSCRVLLIARHAEAEGQTADSRGLPCTLFSQCSVMSSGHQQEEEGYCLTATRGQAQADIRSVTALRYWRKKR